MLDTIQIPILLKAIDFVFDEGRKILEERRERRKQNDPTQTSEPQEPVREMTQAEIQQTTQAKQDLLASKIDELLWRNYEEEVQHLVRLLEKHTRNYYTLREQYAEFGSAFAPPYVVSQLREKENSIIETRKQLETVLSKVYQKDITSNQ